MNPIDVLLWIAITILALVFGSMLVIMLIVVAKELIEEHRFKKNRR